MGGKSARVVFFSHDKEIPGDYSPDYHKTGNFYGPPGPAILAL